MTVEPGSTLSVTNRCSEAAEGVGQDRHPDPSVPAGLVDLDRHADQGFLALGPPAPQSWLLAADEGLVDLHRPGQPIPAGTYQDRAQPMQHRPGGRVGADLQRPLQAQRRDAVLLRGEHPTCREPHRQRGPAPIEQGARGHRRTCPAARALVPAIPDRPAAGMPAAWADEAVRPAQPLQVVQAVRVGGEPGLHLAGRPRKVPTRPRLPPVHGLNLVRSAEYPHSAFSPAVWLRSA